MVRDAALLGLAIVLTLTAGVVLALYEDKAAARGLRFRGVKRPGGVALLFGAGVAALVGGYIDDSLFVLVAGVAAAAAGLPLLRTGGRLSSFLVLFASALGVVVTLGAEMPAFGVRVADIALTAFLLSCLCAGLREFDAAGAGGWGIAVSLAASMTAMFGVIGSSDDRGLAVLTTGAIFGTVAATPLGSGMLGRVGSRFAGLVIGGLAVRGVVGSPGASVAVAVSGLLAFVVWLATLESPYRRRAVTVTLGAGALMAAAAIPAMLALRDVSQPLNRAVATSRGLVRADPIGEKLSATTARLAEVERTFQSSARKLRAAPVLAGRVVPFVSANLRAASVSAQSAANLSRAAKQLLSQINVGSVSVVNATVQQQDLDELANSLRAVQAVIGQSQRAVASGGETDLLVPRLREGVADLETQLASVGRRVDISLDGTVAAKRMLGFDRPRRYFVAVQNNAESRATGGYVANYGILVADNGRLTLPELRRTEEFDVEGARPRVLRASREYTRRYSRFDVDRNWTNVNMSPDFPTVARIMADQYRQFSGNSVDGVLAVDPIALSRLLRLTGPVQVAGWPRPINAANAVGVTLHDAYVVFAERPLHVRVGFLGEVARRVFERLTNGGLTDLKRAGRIVGDLTAGRHLQFYATDELAAKFFQATRSDGAVPPLRGDGLMVTTQNAAANKTDYFLRRSIQYEADVRPTDRGFEVESVLTVSLRNDAPSSGEPRYVIGPYDSRFPAGQNRTYLTVYSPFRRTRATIDGQPLPLDGTPEVGRYAHSAFVDIPAGTTRTVQVRFRGVVSGDERYVLDVVRQPLIRDDSVSLRISGLGPTRRIQGPLKRNIHLEIGP